MKLMALKNLALAPNQGILQTASEVARARRGLEKKTISAFVLLQKAKIMTLTQSRKTFLD